MERTVFLVVRLPSHFLLPPFSRRFYAYLLRFTRSCFDPARLLLPPDFSALSLPSFATFSPCSRVLPLSHPPPQPTCRRGELCAPVAGISARFAIACRSFRDTTSRYPEQFLDSIITYDEYSSFLGGRLLDRATAIEVTVKSTDFYTETRERQLTFEAKCQTRKAEDLEDRHYPAIRRTLGGRRLGAYQIRVNSLRSPDKRSRARVGPVATRPEAARGILLLGRTGLSS